MASTAAQVNSTSSTPPASSTSSPQQDCNAYNPFDPRRSFCQIGQAIQTITNAPSNVAQNVGQNLAQSFAQAIIDLINRPFKALGLNGLNDALWRLGLLFLGTLILGFGLLVFAGSAVKEEAQSPEGQQAAQTAEIAAA